MNFTISTAAYKHFSWSALVRALGASKAAFTRIDIVQRSNTQDFTKNQILKITKPLGVTIECLEGTVWVTLDGDSRDVVLDPGQVFVVNQNEKILLLALTDACVRLIEPIRAH